MISDYDQKLTFVSNLNKTWKIDFKILSQLLSHIWNKLFRNIISIINLYLFTKNITLKGKHKEFKNQFFNGMKKVLMKLLDLIFY